MHWVVLMTCAQKYTHRKITVCFALFLQAVRTLNNKLLEGDRVFVSVLANADGLGLLVKK